MEMLSTNLSGWRETLAGILDRMTGTPDEVDDAVRAIIRDVRSRGDAALAEYTRKFDGFDPAAGGFVIALQEIEQVPSRIDKALFSALSTAASRIESFDSTRGEISAAR